jgi:hypothetical protein
MGMRGAYPDRHCLDIICRQIGYWLKQGKKIIGTIARRVTGWTAQAGKHLSALNCRT